MSLQAIPYVLPLVIAGGFFLLISYYIWKLEKTFRSFTFILILFAGAFWSLAYAFELLITDSYLIYIAANIKYIGITLVPAAWCSFTLFYTERDEEKIKNWFTLLFFVPIISLVLIFTNQWHHLFWAQKTVIETNFISLIDTVNGPFFWFHTAYSYILILFGIFFIFKSLIFSRDIFIKQALLLITGSLAPLLGNVVVVWELIVFPFSYDITPLLFLITAITFTIAIFRYRLLSIIPIARNSIVENLQDGIFVLDENRIIIDVNKYGKQLIKERFFSVSTPQVIGLKACDVFDKLFSEEWCQSTTASLNEVKLNGLQGEKYFEVLGSRVLDKKNKVKGQTVIFRDITSRKASENEEKNRLMRIQRQQSAIVNLSKNQDLVDGHQEKAFNYITEIASKILNINRVSIWLLKNNDRELHCANLYNLKENKHSSGTIIKYEDFPIYFQSLNTGRAIDASDAENDPRTLEFRDSYLIPLDVKSMLDASIRVSGKIVGVICHEQTGKRRYWSEDEILFAGEIADQIAHVMFNAEQKKSEEQIRRTNEDLRKMNLELENTRKELLDLNVNLEGLVKQRTKEIAQVLKQKDEFVNQLGHDLKNPLGPLVNLLPILEKHTSDPQDREMFNVVQRNVSYMKNLVQKTLELAHLNSPNTTLNFEELDLSSLVDSIYEVNQFMFKENNIDVIVHKPDLLMIAADSLRLEEVFTNLLNNAVKYSPDGGVVNIDVEDREKEVLISIHDHGKGMTEEQLNQVFTEFFKVDSSKKEFDSTGLGMTICKRIVEKHGGDIWVESKGLGKGSTFYFTIPKKRKLEEESVVNSNFKSRIKSY